MTAVVGGMLPSKPGDILMEISPVYAQLYLKVNGKYILSINILLFIYGGPVQN